MRRYIRYICAVMAVVLLLTVPAYAEEVTPRASSFFVCYDSSLWKISDNEFEVWFDVVAVDTMDKVGVSRIIVQRSADGSTWTNMKTYVPSMNAQMLCENTAFHSDCVTYLGTPGYYYRAYVTFYAENSTGIGKRYQYSETILL